MSLPARVPLALVLVFAGGSVTSPTPARAQAPAPAAAAPPRLMGQPAAEYARRRRELCEKLRPGDAAASALRDAVARAEGGPAQPEPRPGPVVALVGRAGSEEEGRLHQDEDFAYLTGIDAEGAALLLWPATGEEVLYLPPRDPSQERWTGPRPGPGPDAPARAGFARVESTGQFLADLFRAVADPRTGGRGRSGTVFLVEPTPQPGSATPEARFARFVREGAPGARLVDVAPALHEMRRIKSAPEVDLIRRAIAATADAHTRVARMLAPGVTEGGLEGEIFAAYRAGGAGRAAFPSIVGSGPNSTVLHYGRNDRTAGDGDLVVVDIGAEFEGYAADITRTYPASGRFTPRQREVYSLVLAAQAEAASSFEPGKSTLGALNQKARSVLRSSPLRARDADGVEQSMDHFFTHGLGHHLGLEVHDVGDTTKPLVPGCVFTIEPGIYLPGEGFGVRIEDDYLVTPTGLEKLSGSIPSDPEAVEAAMARRPAQPTPGAAPR